MEIVRYEGVDVDRCTACGGLWFDRTEHEKLRHKRGSEVIDTGDAAVGRKQNAVAKIDCPRCTSRMVRLVDPGHPHIWFESCAVCGGVYLDAGEFREEKSHSIRNFFRDLFAKPRA
jgi:uncharacterized protein